VLVFSYRISPLLISTSSQLEKHGGDGGVNDHQSLLGSRRRERMSQRDNRRSLSNNSSKNRRNRVCSCVPAAIARKLCCSCQVHELVEISNLPSLLLWSTITCSISLVFLAHSEAWHVPSVNQVKFRLHSVLVCFSCGFHPYIFSTQHFSRMHCLLSSYCSTVTPLYLVTPCVL